MPSELLSGSQLVVCQRIPGAIVFGSSAAPSLAIRHDNRIGIIRVTDNTNIPQVLRTKLVRRLVDGATIAVALQRFDIHDLRTEDGEHGSPSNVTEERMMAK